jgi:hypothetical protein
VIYITLSSAADGAETSSMRSESAPRHPDPAALVRETYRNFGAAVATMSDERSWRPTDCVGWSVRDLVFHCVGDAQRGLVALHTPADRAADRDAVTYWSDWQPDPTGAGAAAGRRFIRVVASMFLHVEQLRELYLETTGALVHAAETAKPDELVATQGHVLSAGDLLRTLAVEATIHHLDLAASLCDGPDEATMPTPSGLAEVRRTLDGLLGEPVPIDWDDTAYARKGTGRSPLTPAERQRLGTLADRFPLFC